MFTIVLMYKLIFFYKIYNFEIDYLKLYLIIFN